MKIKFIWLFCCFILILMVCYGCFAPSGGIVIFDMKTDDISTLGCPYGYRLALLGAQPESQLFWVITRKNDHNVLFSYTLDGKLRESIELDFYIPGWVFGHELCYSPINNSLYYLISSEKESKEEVGYTKWDLYCFSIDKNETTKVTSFMVKYDSGPTVFYNDEDIVVICPKFDNIVFNIFNKDNDLKNEYQVPAKSTYCLVCGSIYSKYFCYFGGRKLYIMNTQDASNILIDEEVGEPFAISPNGDYIAYHKNYFKYYIYNRSNGQKEILEIIDENTHVIKFCFLTDNLLLLITISETSSKEFYLLYNIKEKKIIREDETYFFTSTGMPLYMDDHLIMQSH